LKVVAIMGSPHKGNGYKIVQKIEAELKLIDEMDFHYIFLSDVNFQMCKGCFACISKGEKFCPLKDDRTSIEEELLISDGIILSSPGYAWNVSGLMKNFIDRFAYSLHRPKFFKQSLMLVANGGSGIDKAIKALSYTLGGSVKACELSIMATPWEATKKYADKVDYDIKRNTQKFYDSMKNKKAGSPDLGNLIWFNLFKKMSCISKENLPADYDYYNEKKNFFYTTKINPFKNCIANFVAKIGVWSMKKKVIFK
jgi:multimeric flavodoxin WrbA